MLDIFVYAEWQRNLLPVVKKEYIAPQSEIVALHTEAGVLTLSNPDYNNPFEHDEDW